MFDGWDIADVLWRIFRDAGDLRYESLMGLAELEISYYRCEFDAVLAKANELIETAEPPVAVHARTVRMIVEIATGDSEQAYKDLRVLVDVCAKGIAQREDDQLYAACVISGMRIENVVMVSLFEFPDLTEGTVEVPTALKLYFGHLLAQRFMRIRRYDVANGIAYTHLTILNKGNYPGSRTYLYLIEAASNLLTGDTQRARARFDKAWELKERYGLLMPFVELNYLLLGLPRANREHAADPEEIRRVEAMVRTFHKGWYGLRRMCGLSCALEPLTPLEALVAGLAALGWRNKEIAHHLRLAPNTVKHQLTSIYQKLGIANRSQLRGIYHEVMSDPGMFDIWA